MDSLAKIPDTIHVLPEKRACIKRLDLKVLDGRMKRLAGEERAKRLMAIREAYLVDDFKYLGSTMDMIQKDLGKVDYRQSKYELEMLAELQATIQQYAVKDFEAKPELKDQLTASRLRLTALTKSNEKAYRKKHKKKSMAQTVIKTELKDYREEFFALENKIRSTRHKLDAAEGKPSSQDTIIKDIRNRVRSGPVKE